jgi:glycerate dehydrogenase
MGTKIVFLDRKTLGPNTVLRKLKTPCEWINFDRTGQDQIIDRLTGTDIVITNKVPITAQTLSVLPDLKFVAVAATGTNNIDIEACVSNNIPVSNIQGYAATSVAEHTFATILSLRRNLISYREEVIAGRWQAERQFCYFNTPIHDLKGATLGIIGTGVIGRAVADIGKAFGMNVIFHSLSGRKNTNGLNLVGLDELLQGSDVISLHCPLNDTSHNLFDQAKFKQMKSSAILINTARGEIIDIEALERALDTEQIAGAAIDVSPIEPPPVDSPLMRLAPRANFLLTPHTAWASEKAMQTLADQLIDNIEAFLDGSPKRLVT